MILVLLSLSFIFLQAIDFPKIFSDPWVIDIAKFLLFILTVFIIFRLSVSTKKKIVFTVLYFILVSATYQLQLWKLSANSYLDNVREDYSEVVEILNEKGSFGRIFYNPEADSLRIISSNKSSFSKSELSTIKKFMKENWYIEIWEERFGAALIYDRFLDNRRGFILCDHQECRDAMNSNSQSNETYYQFNSNWYYFSSK